MANCPESRARHRFAILDFVRMAIHEPVLASINPTPTLPPKEEGANRWMATKPVHKETRHQAGFFRMNRELLEHSLRGEAGDGFLPVLFQAGVVFGFKAGFQRF